MPVVPTEFACPVCTSEGKTSRINATDASLICTSNGTHIWKDTDQFLKLGPQKAFSMTPPKLGPATPLSEMKLMVPVSVKEALEKKFGGNVDTTVVGFLTVLTEGEVLVVPQSDLRLIDQKLRDPTDKSGAIVASSGELKGMIYSAVMDRDSALEEAKIARDKLAAMRGRNPDMVIINLGDQLESATAQARGRDMQLDEFLETSTRNAIANNWF